MTDREVLFNVYNGSKVGHANVSFYEDGRHVYTIGANVLVYTTSLATRSILPLAPDDGVYRDETAYHAQAVQTGHVVSRAVPLTEAHFTDLLSEARSLEGETFDYAVLTEACIDLVERFYESTGHPHSVGDLFPETDRTGSLVWMRVPSTDLSSIPDWPETKPYYVPEPAFLPEPPVSMLLESSTAGTMAPLVEKFRATLEPPAFTPALDDPAGFSAGMEIVANALALDAPPIAPPLAFGVEDRLPGAAPEIDPELAFGAASQVSWPTRDESSRQSSSSRDAMALETTISTGPVASVNESSDRGASVGDRYIATVSSLAQFSVFDTVTSSTIQAAAPTNAIQLAAKPLAFPNQIGLVATDILAAASFGEVALDTGAASHTKDREFRLWEDRGDNRDDPSAADRRTVDTSQMQAPNEGSSVTARSGHTPTSADAAADHFEFAEASTSDLAFDADYGDPRSTETAFSSSNLSFGALDDAVPNDRHADAHYAFGFDFF